MHNVLNSNRVNPRKANLLIWPVAAISLLAGGAHAQVVAPVTPAPPAAPEGPARIYTLTPTVGAQESYTDNADFTATNRRSDTITRVLLGVDGTLDSPRASGTLRLQGSYDAYANSPKLSGWSYTGDLIGQIDIIKNQLVIDTNAQLSTGSVTTLGETALDRTGTDGRIQVGIYSVGPHLTTTLGSIADIDAGAHISEVTYRPGANSTVLNQPEDATIGNVFLNADTASRFSNYQFTVGTQYTRDDNDFEMYGALGSAFLRVSPVIRLIGRAGYDSVKQPAVVDIEAGRWMLGTELTFNERSTIIVEAGQRYDRPSYSADAHFVLSDRFYLAGSYREEIEPAQISLEDSFLGFVAQTQLPITPLTQTSFTLNGNLFGETALAKTADVSAVYTWPQQSISLSAIWSDQLFLSSNTRDRTLSVDASYQRTLRPDLAAELTADYSKTMNSPLANDFESYGASFRLIYSLRPTTLLSVGYAYQDNKELFTGGQRFYENAAFISLMKTF